MIKALVFALAVMAAIPAQASGRWDAISSGRIYDRLLTPQLNPSFSFVDDRAARLYQKDLAEGRVKPPQKGQRYHLFDFQRR
ncbi:hypothetical protein HPDFL43_17915 [Hoeflea phototrophica DFL-43]|jgi:hypothetical protein|uniref:Uncharacterized protein n=1 Tax=Hoeflea phototrophica (strain DSM 17068 / NCIMB 14078 / DFL-43) TaxID=411684 RepID=A9DG49_HOEPD|nr:hypothetical protein [Hoeflea phototrophica]EDQ31719.1 hypothetical protein HPDFL43_17915 [Hoeflea phototrophica DFL-43]